MKIHSLFIIKESGICTYTRRFTDQAINYDIDLITPFLSAIFTFSDSLLSKEIEVLEMSGLKFNFKKENGYIFTLLSDSNENNRFISSCFLKIITAFLNFCKSCEMVSEYEVIKNQDLDEAIDYIINGEEEFRKFSRHGLFSKLSEQFHDLIHKHEIRGAAILSTKGHVLYTSLSEDILTRSMKELDINFTLSNLGDVFDLPEILYTLDNGQKVCERLIRLEEFELEFLVIIQFASSNNLGMVDWSTELITTAIQNCA